jgi:hypothetical protein
MLNFYAVYNMLLCIILYEKRNNLRLTCPHAVIPVADIFALKKQKTCSVPMLLNGTSVVVCVVIIFIFLKALIFRLLKVIILTFYIRVT